MLRLLVFVVLWLYNLDKYVAIEVQNKKSLRGSGNINFNEVHRTLSQDLIQKFKFEHDIRDDVDLNLQTIGSGNTVRVNEIIYSLGNLAAVNVFATNATCMNNGIDISEECVLTNTGTFVGEQGDKTVLVNEDTSGNIQTVEIIDKDGSETYMAQITEGILANIDPNDTDYVKISKNYFDDESENNGQQNFNQEEIHEEQIGKIHHGYDNGQNRRSLSSNCATFRIIEVAIAFESTFCAAEGGDLNARRKIESIIARASLLYQQQGVCIKLELSHLEGFCDPNTDPYTPAIETGCICCGRTGVLSWFTNYWKTSRTAVHRDVAHLFYHQRFPGSGRKGCATFGGIYNFIDWAYGVESMDFSQDTSRRTSVFAHELDHNLGLLHTRNVKGRSYIMHPGLPSVGQHLWSQQDINYFANTLPLLPNFNVVPTNASGSATPQPTRESSAPSTKQPTTRPTSPQKHPQTKRPTSPPTLPLTRLPTSQPTRPPTLPERKRTSSPNNSPNSLQTRGPTLSNTQSDSSTTISIVGNLCLTVKNSTVNERAEPITSRCIPGTTNQQWEIDSFGRIRGALDNKMCLSPKSFMYGAFLEFVSCSSLRRQKWLLDNGRIRSSLHRHLCLTANDIGKSAYIYPCWKEDDQLWFLT